VASTERHADVPISAKRPYVSWSRTSEVRWIGHASQIRSTWAEGAGFVSSPTAIEDLSIILKIDGPLPPMVTVSESTREFNARGFFVIGPQQVNPSDVLAKMIADQHCAITAATPMNQRRRVVRERAENIRRIQDAALAKGHIDPHAREYLGRYAKHGLRDLVRRLRA
jgi:hypothetical protein